MANVQESNKSTFTPVLTDYIRGVDNPAGSPVSGNITGTALLALLKASTDTYYYGKSNVAYVTSNFSKTSDVTLVAVTGLSHAMTAGGVYRFSSELFVTCHASGGVKTYLTGTCTATSTTYIGFAASTANTGYVIGGAKGTSIPGNILVSTSAITLIKLIGVITVADAGTMLIQFAQNASYGTASTILAGSWLEVNKLN